MLEVYYVGGEKPNAAEGGGAGGEAAKSSTYFLDFGLFIMFVYPALLL